MPRLVAHGARAVLVLSVALSLGSGGLGAQGALTRPELEWRTVETPHFIVHYPAEAAAWTMEFASRIESVRTAVVGLVGNAPRDRVTIVVDDPLGVPNGFALPFLDGPLIVVWPTPPDPSSVIGENRGWGEMLAVHEFAHIAHLTRPSRNPWRRLLWRLSPYRIGPIALKAPRWVDEGYATFVEGKLTGSGRPHGVVRPAVLREWALEGKLPTYTQLDRSSGFFAGDMAYLAGSAFLEWLARRRGEGSLQHLWRRMSARRDRSFDDAFAGVYGGAPDELYGRFTAELTGKALDAERTLREAGVVNGDLVQKLAWYTGAPALSRDGSRMAITLRSRTRPSRVVVWNTVETVDSAAERRARERLLARDPEDVPAISYQPRPKKPIATLYPSGGRPHDEPRFFADGERILVTRSEASGDGALRPDLFVWSYRSGRLQRVTHGASVRGADPAPDGRSAVGVRCLGGVCDLVRVDLYSGSLATLQHGTPDVVFSRPRFSRDGSTVVVGIQREGVARLAVIPSTGGRLREIGPADGANRYDPSFFADGRTVVCVSDRGGVANLERIDISSGAATPLTRVTSAAAAPAPSSDDRDVYFLELYSKGLDLRRLPLDSTHVSDVTSLDSTLYPAVAGPRRPDTVVFARAATPPSRGYGIGPRGNAVLPSGGYGADGGFATVTLSNVDPVGRLSLLIQGTYGSLPSWRGAAMSGVWRATVPSLGVAAFTARERPSEQRGLPTPPSGIDVTYSGATLDATLRRDYWSLQHLARAGFSSGVLGRERADRAARTMGFAEYAATAFQTHDEWRVTEVAEARGAIGRTRQRWQRALGRVAVAVAHRETELRVDVQAGWVNRGAPVFERFVVGGVEPPLLDSAVVSQRLSAPALPVGTATGRRAVSARVSGEILRVLPYLDVIGTGEATTPWHRVVGTEQAFDVPPISLLRLPAIRIVSGFGYSLDEPFRHRSRGYFSLAFRP